MLRNLILAGVAFGAIVGCSPGLTTARRTETPLARGAQVAVLPFENLSGKEGAAEKITEYVILSLQSRKQIGVLEFGQVYEHLRKFRVRSVNLLTSTQIDSLGQATGAGYLVTGTVLEFKETENQYLGKVPQVSINVRVIECATHKTVWTGVANASGDQSEVIFGMGAVRSLEALARQVADKAGESIGALFTR